MPGDKSLVKFRSFLRSLILHFPSLGERSIVLLLTSYRESQSVTRSIHSRWEEVPNILYPPIPVPCSLPTIRWMIFQYVPEPVTWGLEPEDWSLETGAWGLETGDWDVFDISSWCFNCAPSVTR